MGFSPAPTSLVVRSFDLAFGLDTEAIRAAAQGRCRPAARRSEPVPVASRWRSTSRSADERLVHRPALAQKMNLRPSCSSRIGVRVFVIEP